MLQANNLPCLFKAYYTWSLHETAQLDWTLTSWILIFSLHVRCLPRQLASISQIVIKDPPMNTSILTDLDHLIFTWYMFRLNWKTKLWNELIYWKSEYGLILYTHLESNCRKLFWRFNIRDKMFRYINNYCTKNWYFHKFYP